MPIACFRAGKPGPCHWDRGLSSESSRVVTATAVKAINNISIRTVLKLQVAARARACSNHRRAIVRNRNLEFGVCLVFRFVFFFHRSILSE